ncbi:hypothetical protein C772_01438 [Bhargavaea cecembensis DSE10]|uniref:DUF1911 domain-containing protein n=1 Tax=Bhargavaea cecembensis DSE10 TaxID=1235279 RepID=M7ND87_9BACL|nr:PoNi-like cognate immunity protein [Bhargavaea cecembensis]EMR06543.1 hypothetical protein C772_01438 [Bhargavaea cecembensis DSE10]
MIRDTFKDETFFKEKIDFEETSIQEFENLVEQVIRERGEDDPGVHSGYIALSGYYFNKLLSLYSLGAPLDEIKEVISPLVDLMEHTWSPKVIGSYDYYLEVITLLSIGTMLEIDNDLNIRIERLASTYADRDALMEFLLNARRPKQTSFLYGFPYELLLPIITNNDPGLQIQQLASYLKKDWYKGHKYAWWYETHLDEDLIYPGYWSFESGAIVKILGLDDSSLKDVPYYPYDMVHYKG